MSDIIVVVMSNMPVILQCIGLIIALVCVLVIGPVFFDWYYWNVYW